MACLALGVNMVLFRNIFSIISFALMLPLLVVSCGNSSMQSAQLTSQSTDNTSSLGGGTGGNPSSGGGNSPSGSSGGSGSVVTPPPPSATNGVYKVYSGCELPPTSFSRNLYIDAVNGIDATGRGAANAPFQSLNYVISNKLIQSGDHVVVLPGNYISFSLNATQLPASSSWTWFDFQPGANISGLSFSQVARVLITGASIQKTSGDIVSLSSTQQVVVADNFIYSSSAAAGSLTVAEWMALGDAVYVRDGLCNSIYRNQVRNVRFGFVMNTTKTTYPANSMKGLVEENEMQGFSADASRGIGSDLIFRKNKFVDGYASMAEGDANHDDMFQGFALNGAVFENLVVEDNYMLDRSSSGRAHVSDYQGISIFDGLYKNVVVRRNIVLTGAYHGISMYGLDNVLIENNTVATTSGKSLWIGIFNSKTGVVPVNNIVRNNLARQFTGMNLAVNTNNIAIANPSASYVSFDLVNGVFDLHLKSSDPAYGLGTGAL